MKHDRKSVFRVFAEYRIETWVEAESSAEARVNAYQMLLDKIEKAKLPLPSKEDLKVVRYEEAAPYSARAGD